jgi:hypothetical protein
MNEDTARAIVLEYFTKPDFDRVGFLKQKQKESERTPAIFIRYILDAFNYYFDLLQNLVYKARYEGNDNHGDWGIPLYQLAPKIYPPGTGHLYFSQMPEYWEGIKQFMAETNEPENKESQEATESDTKKEPQENHHVQALYLFYTNESVTRHNSKRSIFNKWTLWRDETKRTTVGPIIGFKTKIKHLKSVNIRLQNEGKRKEATQCQKDIDKLRENYNKP